MIGIILRTENGIENMGKEWIPDPINTDDLNSALAEALGFLPKNERFTYDQGSCLIHFTIDDGNPPRSITFNCTPNKTNSAIINSIASKLSAKIYDSEACDFVSL